MEEQFENPSVISRQRQRYDPRRRLRTPLSLALVCLALPTLLMLSACGSANAHPGPPSLTTETPYPVATSRVKFEPPVTYSFAHPFFVSEVTFAPDVTFSQALQQVTSLGLQLFSWCDTIGSPTAWHPLDTQARFVQGSSLEVATTPDAPSDWLARLNTALGVRLIYNGMPGCVDLIPITPTPGDGYFISSPTSEYQTYKGVGVLLTFSAGESYAQALSAVATLGFRLADPCFEQALHTSAAPSWRSPGQAQTFAAAHTLVVATTTMNSTLWQQQLRTIPGVAMIQQPYQPSCAL